MKESMSQSETLFVFVDFKPNSQSPAQLRIGRCSYGLASACRCSRHVQSEESRQGGADRRPEVRHSITTGADIDPDTRPRLCSLGRVFDEIRDQSAPPQRPGRPVFRPIGAPSVLAEIVGHFQARDAKPSVQRVLLVYSALSPPSLDPEPRTREPALAGEAPAYNVWRR
jgi:hypothetical protein